VIATDEIVWDWGQQKSNYVDLRQKKTDEGNGRIWEVESSITVNRQQIEQIVKQGTWSGGPAAQTDEARAAADYLPAKDEQGNIKQTAAQVRDEDLATLFSGIATTSSRVTRLRADLKQAALNEDLYLRAAPDQAVLSNVRQVTKEQGQPLCPVFSGCNQIGTAPRDQVANNNGGGDSTFSCATGARAGNAWLAMALGFCAVAIGQAIRRRKK
jgi:hypothetical protein